MRASIIGCMDAQLAELNRLIHNLLRLGTVAEVDGSRVRVKTGMLKTQWLPWFTHRAGNAVTWWQPSIGEQVMILSPGGDLTAGVVLPAIYSDSIPAPSESADLHATIYPDGAAIRYDSAAHKLTAVLPAGGIVELTAQTVTVHADQATIDASTATCTGDLHVNGTVTADQDVVAQGIHLVTHKHKDTQPGTGKTGVPE